MLFVIGNSAINWMHIGVSGGGSKHVEVPHSAALRKYKTSESGRQARVQLDTDFVYGWILPAERTLFRHVRQENKKLDLILGIDRYGSMFFFEGHKTIICYG